MSQVEFRIFSGSANPKLAEKIAGNLKTSLGEVDLKRFSDGEMVNHEPDCPV